MRRVTPSKFMFQQPIEGLNCCRSAASSSRENQVAFQMTEKQTFQQIYKYAADNLRKKNITQGDFHRYGTNYCTPKKKLRLVSECKTSTKSRSKKLSIVTGNPTINQTKQKNQKILRHISFSEKAIGINTIKSTPPIPADFIYSQINATNTPKISQFLGNSSVKESVPFQKSQMQAEIKFYQTELTYLTKETQQLQLQQKQKRHFYNDLLLSLQIKQRKMKELQLSRRQQLQQLKRGLQIE